MTLLIMSVAVTEAVAVDADVLFVSNVIIVVRRYLTNVHCGLRAAIKLVLRN